MRPSQRVPVESSSESVVCCSLSEVGELTGRMAGVGVCFNVSGVSAFNRKHSKDEDLINFPTCNLTAASLNLSVIHPISEPNGLRC